jgi:hypothetical protein
VNSPGHGFNVWDTFILQFAEDGVGERTNPEGLPSPTAELCFSTKSAIFLLPCWVRLLRVLQDKTCEPLGSTKSLKTNVRNVAATNKSLDKLDPIIFLTASPGYPIFHLISFLIYSKFDRFSSWDCETTF